MSSKQLLLTAIAVLTTFAVAADPPPAVVATAPAGSSPPQPEGITITAPAVLQRRLSSFVQGITDLRNAEGVPRWSEPVCPSVAGLSRDDGEFIVARVSEVALAAHVPLAGENCRPNLNVFMSADPQRELQGLHGHARAVLYSYTSAAQIEAFIARPGAVNVVYKSEGNVDGMPFSAPLFRETETDARGQLQAPVVRGPPGGSHLRSTVVYGLVQVIMIVDQRRLRGLSREQLADYVAMVGLAQINPEAHLGDADTILRLFDSAPGAAPAGMSRWDQAFLKALYATDQESKTQRDDMARVMVRELLAEPAAPQAGESGTQKP